MAVSILNAGLVDLCRTFRMLEEFEGGYDNLDAVFEVISYNKRK